MGSHEPEKAGEYYVLATGPEGEARLELLDAVYGPSTRELLADVGLLPGMSAADIGCGAGEVACWLADRVGTMGTVVGLDSSTDQLAIARQNALARGLTQVRFVAANAYSTGLPREVFDLVCCRSLLSHLQHPLEALREMSTLVRPGGSLVCEDIDMTTLATDPPTAAYARVVEILLALGEDREADYRVGADLEALFQAVGYAQPDVRTDQPAFRTGEAKRLWEYTFLELAPALLQARVTTAAEVAALKPELARIGTDDTISVAQARKTQVWARKAGA
ncbi:MAG: methyltransferase domain-containing protein [Actinomycetes bacterium]